MTDRREQSGGADYAVRFENLQKIYKMGNNEVRALDGVSATFEKGSFWAIMGPSGSGKSTMLNLLGCLDRPTAGKYYLDGRDVSKLDDDDLSDIRLKYLGFIFQSFNLIPQLTVEENIALPLYYLGWSASERTSRAQELAALVGLEKRLRHRPTELSGGQQQRVAIARALSNDPVFLLADEPTGNLDSVNSLEIIELLVKLNHEGKTIIMVTHEPHIAAHASKRLYMMDGKIQKVEG
ncbi:MAG: ABC transporter ATP-binding protein [Lentisphaerae bacterium]|nr:ABC transporter ATP-binding protein [Lentisphaerota bacterium]